MDTTQPRSLRDLMAIASENFEAAVAKKDLALGEARINDVIVLMRRLNASLDVEVAEGDKIIADTRRKLHDRLLRAVQGETR